jgi:hypothetical protein
MFKNYMKTKTVITGIAILVALTLFLSPILAADDALAKHKNKNKAKQSIDQ